MRLQLYQETKPDYYYKDILVAPRKESLLKVCAAPFERPTDGDEGKLIDFEQSAFRDWVAEDQKVLRNENEDV